MGGEEKNTKNGRVVSTESILIFPIYHSEATPTFNPIALTAVGLNRYASLHEL